MKKLLYTLIALILMTSNLQAQSINLTGSNSAANILLPLDNTHTQKFAGVYWLPDYLKDNADYNERSNEGGKEEGNKTCTSEGKVTCASPYKGVGNSVIIGGQACYSSCTCQATSDCTPAFNLSSPPANAIYSSCSAIGADCVSSGGLYKIDSCKQGYQLSDSNCIIRTCTNGFTAGLVKCPNETDDYSTDGYSGVQVCGKCTDTCSADYQYETCPVGANCGASCGGKFKVESCQTNEGYQSADRTCEVKLCAAGFTPGLSECTNNSDIYSHDGKSGGKVCGKCASGCDLDGYTIASSSVASSTCGSDAYDSKTCNSVTKYKCLSCQEYYSKMSTGSTKYIWATTVADLSYNGGISECDDGGARTTKIIMAQDITTSQPITMNAPIFKVDTSLKACSGYNNDVTITTDNLTINGTMCADINEIHPKVNVKTLDVREAPMIFNNNVNAKTFTSGSSGSRNIVLMGQNNVIDHFQDFGGNIAVEINGSLKTVNHNAINYATLAKDACITDGNGYQVCGNAYFTEISKKENEWTLPNDCPDSLNKNDTSSCSGSITTNCPLGSYAYMMSCVPTMNGPAPDLVDVDTTDGISGICKKCVALSCSAGYYAATIEETVLMQKCRDNNSSEFGDIYTLNSATATQCYSCKPTPQYSCERFGIEGYYDPMPTKVQLYNLDNIGDEYNQIWVGQRSDYWSSSIRNCDGHYRLGNARVCEKCDRCTYVCQSCPTEEFPNCVKDCEAGTNYQQYSDICNF